MPDVHARHTPTACPATRVRGLRGRSRRPFDAAVEYGEPACGSVYSRLVEEPPAGRSRRVAAASYRRADEHYRGGVRNRISIDNRMLLTRRCFTYSPH